MSPTVRALVGLLVQLVLVFFAGWFAFKEDALWPGAHGVSRAGIAILCVVLGILVSELSKVRAHFGMVIGALKAAAASGRPPDAAALPGPPAAAPDPRAAVDILLQAMSSDDAETQEKAHRHLVRLTGKDLPPETALWERWWQENRDGFPGPEGG